jgi:regulator of protease activity HflC (stomatin/prohibitin superfamily)
MADESTSAPAAAAPTQLVQVRVPLEEAGEAFGARDASGRIPIVLVPQQLNRVRNEPMIAGAAVLFGALLLHLMFDQPILIPLGILAALLLILIGTYRAFIVRVPEGANALLARGGRYIKTIGSGTHIISPVVVVTHLVTRREIPFDVPLQESPTKDNVRASVDTLITFSIVDPFKFVYSISANDFDQVFQAASQDGLRRLVRSIHAEQVADLTRQDVQVFRGDLNSEMETYGVQVSKVTVTSAEPTIEVVLSLEARQVAAVQQAEQIEKQLLAQRRQKDQEDLARQEVLARVEREKELLQLKMQETAMRRQLTELEAEIEEIRLSKLQQRLHDYHDAAAWELQRDQLEVSRALAGNAHAVVQIGAASELLSAFALHEVVAQQDEGRNGPAK